MFLSMISIDSCMIIHYIEEESIFLLLFICFVTEYVLKRHIKDCFKTNGQQTIKISKKGEYVKFKY